METRSNFDEIENKLNSKYMGIAEKGLIYNRIWNNDVLKTKM